MAYTIVGNLEAREREGARAGLSCKATFPPSPLPPPFPPCFSNTGRWKVFLPITSGKKICRAGYTARNTGNEGRLSFPK